MKTGEAMSTKGDREALYIIILAPVVELADTQDLESCAERRRGSNPLGGILVNALL